MTKIYVIDDSILEIKKVDTSTSQVQSHVCNGPILPNYDTKSIKPDLHALLLDRLFYISHPSMSSLECSINLNNCSIGSEEVFNSIVQEIMQLASFNPKQVKKIFKTFSVIFKDVAALKLLNVLFKGHEDHALFPLYTKWLSGGEWMASY